MSSIKKDVEGINRNSSNDPEIIFNLFINRLIGPNKVSTYSKLNTRNIKIHKVYFGVFFY